MIPYVYAVQLARTSLLAGLIFLLLPTITFGKSTEAFATADVPIITAISISHGPTGTSMELAGVGLGTSGTVTIGGLNVKVVDDGWTNTRIVCMLSSDQVTNLPVIVTRSDGQVSSSVQVSYDPPFITSISPASGPTTGGTPVTLTGLNFGNTSALVTIGGRPSSVSSQSPTQLVVTRPAGQVGAQPIVVTAGGQISNSLSFTYVAEAPKLTSITPNHGSTSGGTSLTLTGTGLSASGVVSIGGVMASITGSYSDTAITVNVPSGEGIKREVTVTVGGQFSNALEFDYDAPTITSISPNHGSTSGGTSLTVLGTSFGTSGFVTIGGITAPVTGSYSHTAVVVNLPAGQGTNLPVQMTVSGQSSTSSVTFNYDAPALISVSPATGTSGNTVELIGTSLGASGTVTVGGVSATVVSGGWGHTHVSFLLPSGQGTNQPVVVTRTDGQVSNSLLFSYNPPTITVITPASGPTTGGITLTLMGTNFGVQSASVSIGGQAASVSAQSSTQLVVTSPAGQAGAQPVVVTVGGQVSNSVSFSYVAVAPTLTSLIPNHGSTSGGTSLTLTGTNLGSNSQVSISGVTAPVTASYSTTAVVVISPAGQGLDQTVVLTSGGQFSNSLSFDYDAPTITSITPNHGSTSGGTSLTLVGTSFGFTGSVTIGGNVATTSARSHTSIVVTLPAGQGTNLPVFITVAGQASSSSVFFNYHAPMLTAISPINGPTSGSSVISLSGTNLGRSGVVTIGGVTATAIAGKWTDTGIECILPAGMGTNLPVVVTVAGQVSNSLTFSYDAPTLLSISPATGTSGGSMTLMGTSLGTSGTVTIGGVAAPLTSWSHTQIQCLIPAGVGVNLPVIVTRADGQVSSPLLFSYGAPVISNITPASGLTTGGTSLMLMGSNFGVQSASVSIGGQAASVSSQTPTQLVVTTPAGQAGAQPVIVTVGGQISNSVSFSYVAVAPMLTSIMPNHGSTSGGTSLTLTGANLGSGGQVSIGGVAAPITQSYATTAVVVTSPAGQGTNLPVFISLNGQISNSLTFNYDGPTLASISPANGPTQGNIEIHLTGSSFGRGGIVTIGGLTATLVKWTDTQIDCILPAGEGLNKQVSVFVGSTPSNSLNFSYDAPSITSITPNHGSTSGGTSLIVLGSNFGLTGSVTIGGVSALTKVRSHTSIEVTLPEGQGANLPVVVTVLERPSNGVNFSYDAPVLTSMSPANGPTRGGQVISLIGANFGRSGTVTIGDAPVSLTGVDWTATRIDFVLPEGIGTNLPVVVTVSGQVSNSLTFSYDAPTLLSISPATGTSGSSMTLMGTSLGTSGTVTIGGVPAQLVSGQWLHSQVECLIPPGQGMNLPVVLIRADGKTTNSLNFSYTPPTITVITPASGPTTGGTTLTLMGSNFGLQAASVTVGGQAAVVTSQSPTQLVVTTPAGQAGAQPVVVTVGGQVSNSVSFTYVAVAPTLTSTNPNHGATSGGTSLTLIGTNLDRTGVVTIGGVMAPITQSYSTTAVVVSSPAGQGIDRQVMITIGASQSNLLLFNYDTPVIINVSPNHGSTSGGNSLTLTGTNFGTSGSVTIGGLAAPTTGVYSHTSIVVTLPSGQGTDLPVVVTVAGQVSSSSVLFSYDAPALTAMTPVNGPTSGSSVISLIGTSLGRSGVVTIGGVAATPVAGRWTDTRIECILPAGMGTNLPVVVTVAGQQSNSLAFSYDAPALISMTPANGSIGGSMTLLGTSLGTSGRVTVGGVSMSIVSWSHTQIQCLIPPGEGVNLPVVITRADGQTSNQILFSYNPPAITTINPASGPTTGGTSLTITGADFGANPAKVSIGGQAATVNSQSLTQLVVTTPAGQAGAQPVVVTASGQVSNSVSFSYIAPAGRVSVSVQSLDGDNGQTSNNSINPTLRLVNTGTTAVPYSELTVRYWFTAENFAGINTWVDYAQLGSNRVKMNYVRFNKPYQGADGYIEYSFDASAGNLSATTNSGPIQSRLANQNWAFFNELDDYSYQSGTAYADNNRITVYRTIAGGQPQLIWGTEPTVATLVMKFAVLSENRNTNTSSNQISTNVKVNNVGNVPVNYSDLTMRYWFTADGKSSLSYWIDYAEMGSGKLGAQFKSLTPVLNGADTYLELSFKNNAGTFAASGTTGIIQFRAAKADWSSFDETNDYSFKTSAPIAENNHIALYYKGQLVYGTEPLSSARLMAPSTGDTAPLQIRIIGNPAEGNQAQIEIRNVLNQMVDLVLFDSKGVEVSRQTVYQDSLIKQYTLGLDGVGSGLYLLKATTSRESITTKLIRR
ncbi:T9SS type A sorting domain-containing protein [Spirosoma sp. KCTC 42546]|uniref:IPT/TIG domain-containing protein n=1 Tax=Spirosoma sp. KCTC 42546 TaxID=2520506 RepID=UPI00115B7779|nr:IPT/TIG domain-containing protein [Spirosoma sp. KCTC 42546]QDK77941.1 T9SS type A sorting domain-containing protein [Spirosoma sp. KCTC 42546]